METLYVLDFSEISSSDVARVGGKNASLGELFRALSPRGVGVLDGFATTAAAYRQLLATGGLEDRLRPVFAGLDVENIPDLARRGQAARTAVLETPLPEDLKIAVLAGYDRLCERGGGEPELAVRSSATAEDLPEASFAGAAETFLNVRGRDGLAARRPRVLLVAVHRPRHQLSRAARIRPAEGGALGRRHADGAVGPRPALASSSHSTPSPAFATWSRSPAPTVWASSSCRAW